MEPGAPKKPPVRPMRDGELEALLGDGVLMFTAARPRASSPDASEKQDEKPKQLSDPPPADPTSSAR